MEQLKIVDMTLRECETVSGIRLSFKERLEIAKLLERLRVDVIETGYISDSQAGQHDPKQCNQLSCGLG